VFPVLHEQGGDGVPVLRRWHGADG
jgi:hypothetical protein